jgi:hypothetical protein
MGRLPQTCPDSAPWLVLRYGAGSNLALRPRARWRPCGSHGKKHLNERCCQASARNRCQSYCSNQHQGSHHTRKLRTRSPKADHAQRATFDPPWSAEGKRLIGLIESGRGSHSDPLIVEPCALDRRVTWLGIWPQMTECCCSTAFCVERCPSKLRDSLRYKYFTPNCPDVTRPDSHARTANSHCR